MNGIFQKGISIIQLQVKLYNMMNSRETHIEILEFKKGPVHYLTRCSWAVTQRTVMKSNFVDAYISWNYVNPSRAKFFRGGINIYLHFMSLLHINMTQVLKILPQIRPGLTYSTYSISWLLMSWRRKEPGHQQPWYWPSLTPHATGLFINVQLCFSNGRGVPGESLMLASRQRMIKSS